MIIEVSRLKEAQAYALEAAPEMRHAIAARLGAPDVASLSGMVTVTPTAEGAAVTGNVEAVLRRDCVITLDPIEEHIAESFDIRFARGVPQDAEIELDLDEEWIEPLAGDTLDLADILVQQVALAMAPYPRKDGVEAPASLRPSAEEVSPFAVLKGLKPQSEPER